MLTLANEELRQLRKRFLKPLLAPALAGEPWKPALGGDGVAVDAQVVAACVVSYASRCDADWASREAGDLMTLVESSAIASCERFDRDQWPFVHALVSMLRSDERALVEPLVGRFQQRYRASLSGTDTPSAG